MPNIAIKLTSKDHGRAMTLDEFDEAEAEPGQLFELGRGIIVVTEVPRPNHGMLVDAIRTQVTAFKLAHPGQFLFQAAGSDCKILLSTLQSERHPDLAVYTTPPPSNDNKAWSVWVPALVVEIVSPGSEQRDYVEKREEYLQFGIREYWIVDATKQEMLALQRSRGQWEEHLVRPPALYRSLSLPGFEFNLASVFSI